MAAEWTWVLGSIPPTGVERRQLTRAYGRALTMRVDGPFTAQFSLDGRGDEAAEVVALATDLHIYRDGIKLFRGRIGPEQDAISESEHSVQFTATDYRGMLDYRVVGAAGVTFTQVDQGAIPWQLIQASQALTGGNWGITNGIGAVGTQLRDRTYDAGKPLGEAITELGRVANGFEWDIDPTLSLRRWYPTRGVNAGVLLDYGGKVAKVSRLLSPKDFANFVIASGDGTTTPVTATSATIATDPRGRWETAVGSTIVDQTTLVARAPWLLAQMSVLTPELSITMAPERWAGPSEVGIGDTISLQVQSGRLAFLGLHRVVEMVLVPGEDGTETVTMGLVPL